MKWVDALKLWNADHKNVNTKSVYAVPRKDTKDYKEVKEVMEKGGIPKKRKVVIKRKEANEMYSDFTNTDESISVEKVMNMRGEQRAPKEIVAEKVVNKKLSNVPELSDGEQVMFNQLNDVIKNKSRWENSSESMKDYLISQMNNIRKSVLYRPFRHLLLDNSKHINDYINENE